MAGLSSYLRNAYLNYLRGTAMPTAPTALYVSLHTADPVLTGASEVGAGVGYARQVVTFNVPSDVGEDALIDNIASLTFGPATGAGFGTVSHFGVHSAVTAGNFFGGGFCTAQTVVAGQSYSLAVGAIDITLR